MSSVQALTFIVSTKHCALYLRESTKEEEKREQCKGKGKRKGKVHDIMH